MRLRVAYSIGRIPVEVEVESEALTPDMIPKVLGSILEELNSWIDMVLLKLYSEGGGKRCAVDQGQAQLKTGPLACT